MDGRGEVAAAAADVPRACGRAEVLEAAEWRGASRCAGVVRFEPPAGGAEVLAAALLPHGYVLARRVVERSFAPAGGGGDELAAAHESLHGLLLAEAPGYRARYNAELVARLERLAAERA